MSRAYLPAEDQELRPQPSRSGPLLTEWMCDEPRMEHSLHQFDKLGAGAAPGAEVSIHRSDAAVDQRNLHRLPHSTAARHPADDSSQEKQSR
jgi:hypothetical protein